MLKIESHSECLEQETASLNLLSSVKIHYRRIFHDLPYELRQILKGCESVLDLGCGPSSPIRSLPRDFHSVGIDIYEKSVEESKRKCIHNEYFVMDTLDIEQKFQPNSFDCVLAIDLIEHLEKKDGVRLIQLMEKIAKKKVVIFTPNGFLFQQERDGNLWQIHRSGWTVQEMRKMGYRVIGMSGIKFLRGERASLKFSPRRVWVVISDLTQLFVRNRPDKAFQILCIKEFAK